MGKIATFLLISFAVVTASCTGDDNTLVTQKFNLVNVTGGFAGVNESFDKDEIIWTFIPKTATLIVEKNTEVAFSGLEEGTYSYFILDTNEGFFIHIDNTEKGGLSNFENGMVIDENITSTGSGADGFVFKFEK